jgi:predicted DNA-binding transcriptional regulator AlpA
MKKISYTEREMLSPADVETLFGIPRGSLANLRWEKRGPRYFKVGARRVLYRLADIRAWTESAPVLTKESQK